MLHPGSLTITATTIVMVNMGRTWRFELAKFGEFRTWRVPRGHQSRVVFEYPSDFSTRWAWASRQLAGASHSLLDTYGMSADVLAALLNQARRACLEHDRADPSGR